MENWENPKTILIGLSLGLFIIFILLVFIWVFVRVYTNKIKQDEKKKHLLVLQHQKKLLRNNIETQEKERKRIAEDLHDDVISQLYRIKLMNTNTSINELIKNGITTTRTISHILSPPLLAQTSFKGLIVDFMEVYQKNYNIHITVTSEENIVNNSNKLNIFRIFQEVITNCNKHAKARDIHIIWRASKKHVSLIIKDNGIGTDAKAKGGMGFKNIESRIQTLGGHHKFKQNQPKGTTFILLTNNE